MNPDAEPNGAEVVAEAPAGNGAGSMEAGVQPIDGILRDLGIDNHTLVGASAEPLTHKMVMKARKGRRLTRRIQDRICRAMNRLGAREAAFHVDELFNYRGR